MKAIKGDFVGFTFNGYHSSDLGIVRVSDSDRYNENLLPEIKDGTVEAIGVDGVYFFNSFYGKKTFDIKIAFDNLSEEQFRKLRQVFGDKKIHDLIFDEVPYKVYQVKTAVPPNLKYVCFDNPPEYIDVDFITNKKIYTKEDLYGIGPRNNEGRVYKGEGQLSFVSYYPYAKSRFKYIDNYVLENLPEWGSIETGTAEDVHYNLYDWIDSVGLRLSDSTKHYNNKTYIIDTVTSEGVMYYNPGDLPTSFYLDFIFENEINNFKGLVITDTYGGKTLAINKFDLYSDNGFRINTKLNLIEGLILQNGEYVLSGNVYNEYIENGDFFKLPTTNDLEWLSIMSLSSSESLTFTGKINYDYLYY